MRKFGVLIWNIPVHPLYHRTPYGKNTRESNYKNHHQEDQAGIFSHSSLHF